MNTISLKSSYRISSNQYQQNWTPLNLKSKVSAEKLIDLKCLPLGLCSSEKRSMAPNPCDECGEPLVSLYGSGKMLCSGCKEYFDLDQEGKKLIQATR